jgi:hypothetical protein
MPEPLVMPSRHSAGPRGPRGALLALLPALAALLFPLPGGAQISVNPTGVNVNTFAETVVFLTFGGLRDHVPVEALWCGEVEDAFPDVGVRCVPSTVLGALPATFDLSRPSGSNALSDIMTIPAAVSRRAYELALQGGRSEFFYVRRFRSPGGGPDIFVPVTCRLAGGGARVPFALVDVRLSFAVETPVLTVVAGSSPPAFGAAIRYNGSGLLTGRWEVVLPGDEAPGSLDLLPEGSLPVELRERQRRYAEVGRFSVFLPPSGAEYTLPGPDPERLPSTVEGGYQLLLRVEASADKEGDTNLAAVGAGTGVVHTGGLAPFPIPPLRYYVGNVDLPAGDEGRGVLQLLVPAQNATLPSGEAMILAWSGMSGVAAYRVEVEDAAGVEVARALLGPGAMGYRLPPWSGEVGGTDLRWRVVALNPGGRILATTPWRRFSRAPAGPG